MARVVLERVTKRFDRTLVIPELDLEVEDGEFMVLVGPSGCGKTTTLRMIAGLENVSSGRIRIGDRDVTRLPPGKRNCAMVFQSYALYPHMTVRDNITYGLRVRRVPKDEIQRLLDEAVRILGLAPFLDRRPKQLSGGQQQRVAIGRAIVRQPEVFLFDEPLSNLDAKLRVEMRTEIKLLHRRLGNTVVYVTHDQVEAMTLADRVCVMNEGRIEQLAPPLELYEKPANRFVGSFIGTPAMNFLEAVADRHEGRPVARIDAGVEFPLPPEFSSRDLPERILLGIRPEHVGPPPGEIEFEMQIREIEPLGPQKLLIGELAGNRFVAQVDAYLEAQRERPRRLAVPLARLHLFDAATGRRLG